MNTPTQNTEHTAGPWRVDDGLVRMEDQIAILQSNLATERQWVAVGIDDDDGFAEVVALSHPINAALIARAPALLADNQRLREQVAQLTEALFRLTDHAMETHSHFESPRGQHDIGVAIEALGQEESKRLAFQSRVAATLSAVERGQND